MNKLITRIRHTYSEISYAQRRLFELRTGIDLGDCRREERREA
jgi:hypothetical protein